MNGESIEMSQLFVYERKAGRLELFIRILYWIAIGIVLTIYRFLAVIQWFVMLILGRKRRIE